MKLHRHSHIEKLEPRTLLSAWSTVDSPFARGGTVYSMAADRAGDVHAVGRASYGTALLREKPAGSPDVPGSWNTVLVSMGNVIFDAVAVNSNGGVFVGGAASPQGNIAGDAVVWELAKGASPDGFKVVDDVATGVFFGLAIDADGNVYAAGDAHLNGDAYWTVRKGTYDPSSGSWSFATVDQVASQQVGSQTAPRANGITVIDSGPATGIYAVGAIDNTWVVRKSADGGNTWAQVDDLHSDPSVTSGSAASVAGDSHGNAYVAGNSYPANIRWLVRKSADGGATWSTDDDYQPGFAIPNAVGTDPAGNVYVAGLAFNSPGSQIEHAIVRTNAGGRWTTVDDHSGYYAHVYNAFTVDAAGNLYAGGQDDSGWLIRSAPCADPNGHPRLQLPAGPRPALQRPRHLHHRRPEQRRNRRLRRSAHPRPALRTDRLAA